jgi:hypothetical protein
MKCFKYKLKDNHDGSLIGPAVVLPEGSVLGYSNEDGWYYGCAHIDSVEPYQEYQMGEITREELDEKTQYPALEGFIKISHDNMEYIVGATVDLSDGSTVVLTEENIHEHLGKPAAVVIPAERISIRSYLPKRWILKTTLLERLEKLNLDDAAYEMIDHPDNKKYKRKFDSALLLDTEDVVLRQMLSLLPGCDVEKILSYDKGIELLNLSH